jgi:hypothetical protein
MTKQYVDDVLALIRPFFDEVQAHIDTMKIGDKVPATALAAKIAERHDMTGPQLYPTLKFFFDNCPELEVRRGAHGGLFKVALKTEVVAATDSIQSGPAQSAEEIIA